MSVAAAAERSVPPLRPWTLAWCLTQTARVLGIALLGCLLSVLIEWLGMLFWWPEQGAAHSARLLQQELALLGREFPTPAVGLPPLEFAEQTAARVYHYSGLAWLKVWLSGPPGAADSALRDVARGFAAPFLDYLQAAVNISQLYGVRIAVVLLSLPVFVLAALVGLADGLVQRDLRRFGGGIESGFIYHHLKPLLKPLIWLPVLVYLACPVSLHPNAVFLPPAALFALIVAKTTSRFKKYL